MTHAPFVPELSTIQSASLEKPASMEDVFGGNEVGPVPNPFPVYDMLREHRPAMPVQGMAYSGYLLTRYDDVKAALKNHEVFSNRGNAKHIGLVFGRTIQEMDGKEHIKHRKIVSPALAPRALQKNFAGAAKAIADELIDKFADKGDAELGKEFTFGYPLRVFMKIIGLPEKDLETVHKTAADLTKIGVDPMKGLQAAQELTTYLTPIVEARRSNPSDDLLSRLVTAEVDGDQLSVDEVVSFAKLLVLAGAETTYHLIGTVLLALLAHPEQLAEVTKNRELVVPALDEALRWDSPVQIVCRETVSPIELAGVKMEADTSVLVVCGAANRDPAMFKDPEVFDIHRNTKDHIAFGSGQHFCAGSRVAYLEAEIALNSLLDRLPNLRPGSDMGQVVGMSFRGPTRVPVQFG